MIDLKRDSTGNLLPIKEDVSKVPPLQDIIIFFRYGFAPGERKFKALLLVQMGARIRVHEACAIHLRDFVPGTGFRKFKVLIQKRNCNYIVTKEIPEACAAYLRAWISDNYEWILRKEGYVFPHTNNRSLYTPPHSVQDWFCRKRKQLIKLFPGRSFGALINQKEHLWRSHAFKHIPLTLIQMLYKDIEFTKAMACHKRSKTTSENYIDQVRMLENREGQVMNKLFDQEFYDAIYHENENMTAVWEEIKK